MKNFLQEESLSVGNDERSIVGAETTLKNTREAKINHEDVIAVMLAMLEREKVYKSYLLIPHRDRYIPLAADNIAYIYLEDRTIKIVTLDNQTYFENISLEEMQRDLDPNKFFRANRQFIISHRSVKYAASWFNSKLLLDLVVTVPEKIVVSKARIPEFKKWYTNRKK